MLALGRRVKLPAIVTVTWASKSHLASLTLLPQVAEIIHTTSAYSTRWFQSCFIDIYIRPSLISYIWSFDRTKGWRVDSMVTMPMISMTNPFSMTRWIYFLWKDWEDEGHVPTFCAFLLGRWNLQARYNFCWRWWGGQQGVKSCINSFRVHYCCAQCFYLFYFFYTHTGLWAARPGRVPAPRWQHGCWSVRTRQILKRCVCFANFSLLY